MPDYHTYDSSHLDRKARKELGTVYVSAAAREFFDVMVNEQGIIQLDECLTWHSQGNRGLVLSDEDQKELGIYDERAVGSLYDVGDILIVSTDRVTNRTYVHMTTEESKPPAR